MEHIKKKAKRLQHLHVANVNSTYSGGGVAELLTLLTLLISQGEVNDTGAVDRRLCVEYLSQPWGR